jgi:single-stranded-DNA-specific exonuclease
MEPFGPENMRPTFLARKVVDTGFSKIVKEDHIRFVIQQREATVIGIGFNLADKFSIVESRKPFDIVFKIDENEWKGNKSLQLKVEDIREAEE